MDRRFWINNSGDADFSDFKPNPALTRMWESFDRNWAILDAGCGDGQNTLFLAERGFRNIDAFDISGAGIRNLMQNAERKHLVVNAWVQNLTLFTFRKQYDLIMSFGALHFVAKTEWKLFIEKAKLATRENGIHMMQILTDKIPVSGDIAPFIPGLSHEGELKDQYMDWFILQADSQILQGNHATGSHLHSQDIIVARKPSLTLYDHEPGYESCIAPTTF